MRPGSQSLNPRFITYYLYASASSCELPSDSLVLVIPRGFAYKGKENPFFPSTFLGSLAGHPPSPTAIKLIRTSLERERERKKNNNTDLLIYIDNTVTYQVARVVKNPPANAGWISRSGRSPEGGSGYPLQYSCLENPMD